MAEVRPDTAAILSDLKDFQRETVEYVFRRMYVDAEHTRRFLVADEVGLGKTLIARGLIAKAIEHLWDRTERIDIVYVCSNAEIARQNITRLNVTGHEDFTLSSRITLLPISLNGMEHRRLNFVSFTPGTSFDLKDSAGRTEERELLYWLLADLWELKRKFKPATRVLEGYAGTESFRDRVTRFRNRYAIHSGIAKAFAEAVSNRGDLSEAFGRLCEAMPRSGVKVPPDIAHDRNRFVGELRKLLAQTCLKWLEPDLIILDEFQRFKHLLGSEDDKEPSEAAQLAEHLFNYEASQSDQAVAARVLLLSATPYKMFTLAQESAQDDHYADFEKTLRFLIPDPYQRGALHQNLSHYRDALLRLAETGSNSFIPAKEALETSLRNVMVRTERLAVTADRNGMLKDVAADGVQLKAADVRQYLALQSVARAVGHDDMLEYWKSSPYLLSFMEDYDVKKRLRTAISTSDQDPTLVKALQHARQTLLDASEIESYQKLDSANPRLRSLYQDMIASEAWRLLWVPPSLPYYQGAGPFAEERLSRFTKRLVFSCWKVVPKTVAAVLSYEAERQMTRCFRRRALNTTEARKKRRPLLRFTFSKGRPTGLPVLGLIYPCRTLASGFDPLKATKSASDNELLTLEEVCDRAEQEAERLIAPVIERWADPAGSSDERWYWAAPLLLDREFDAESVRAWFEQPNLANVWNGDAAVGKEAGAGWKRHVNMARKVIVDGERLGQPPADLARTIAELAIASPGVTALRMLSRLVSDDDSGSCPDLRDFAAPIAHGFLHLFNLPEVMSLLRDRQGEIPYWQSVLRYCVAGNLQSVLDEWGHLLAEAASMTSREPSAIARKLKDLILPVLSLRTTTAQADILRTNRRRAKFVEPIRMRTRFAMRFGHQKTEETNEDTSADHVRAAFNSPFWPFVLTTTSVGQEGLDFHPYCHAVVHWNLPSNPVDLEQREGRVHRYKGHALRKNIATAFRGSVDGVADPWASMFEAAKRARPGGECDLSPFWIYEGPAQIERHVPALPLSRDRLQKEALRRSLVLYRMVFGQNRQEDLVTYLMNRLSPVNAEKIAECCRIDLSPVRKITSGNNEKSQNLTSNQGNGHAALFVVNRSGRAAFSLE